MRFALAHEQGGLLSPAAVGDAREGVLHSASRGEGMKHCAQSLGPPGEVNPEMGERWSWCLIAGIASKSGNPRGYSTFAARARCHLGSTKEETS